MSTFPNFDKSSGRYNGFDIPEEISELVNSISYEEYLAYLRNAPLDYGEDDLDEEEMDSDFWDDVDDDMDEEDDWWAEDVDFDDDDDGIVPNNWF